MAEAEKDRTQGITVSANGCNDDARILASEPTRQLTRDVVGVAAIKIALLAVIYALFFWGASHRLSIDTVTHIAGVASSTQAR